MAFLLRSSSLQCESAFAKRAGASLPIKAIGLDQPGLVSCDLDGAPEMRKSGRIKSIGNRRFNIALPNRDFVAERNSLTIQSSKDGSELARRDRDSAAGPY